jgi:hypothetical protein
MEPREIRENKWDESNHLRNFPYVRNLEQGNFVLQSKLKEFQNVIKSLTMQVSGLQNQNIPPKQMVIG